MDDMTSIDAADALAVIVMAHDNKQDEFISRGRACVHDPFNGGTQRHNATMWIAAVNDIAREIERNNPSRTPFSTRDIIGAALRVAAHYESRANAEATP